MISAYLKHHSVTLIFALILLLGAGIYVFRVTRNPAGFFVDESSIAYNAFSISQNGRDEFGNVWPLFFAAFGDYKNPVTIYLLALLFKFTGPSILTARLLSAFAGLSTALILGWLAKQISRKQEVGLLVATTALLTPWLFETSRVTLEVALYPAAVSLFLACVWRASNKISWTWLDALCLASTLALLTYTYSIGRLLAPLFALGLLFFFTRARLSGLLKSWALYALSLLPMLIYQSRHPKALTARYEVITYMKPGTSLRRNVWEFAKHYAGNLDPRRLILHGDPNIYQVVHVYGKPAMLAASVVLAFVGLFLIVLHHGKNAWWRFIIYCLAVSIVPASLTVDYFHMLRLIAMPVFLLLLMIPAIAWLASGSSMLRATLALSVILIIAQGSIFQWQYHANANSAWRLHLFDAEYPAKIFDTAIATGAKPIYLADAMATPYIQAYWYATLKGVPLAEFVRLHPEELPPVGAVVISTEEQCAQNHVLAQVEPYTVYIAESRARSRAPLPDSAFSAKLELTNAVPAVSPQTMADMNVLVRNTSDTTWPGCERATSMFQIYLGSHWIGADGKWIREEGRAPLPAELAPGQETVLKFSVLAPAERGEYELELDMLQEGVTWFGVKGSPTTRVRIRVE